VILHRDGVSRRDDTAGIPTSVPEIGRFLRRERTRQGLPIEEVSARTGLAPQVLQGLEGGTVDRLPDRVQTLKVLRRYADFLGLPGDRYVLVLVDHWPTGSLATPVVSMRPAPPVAAVPLASVGLGAAIANPEDTAAVPVVTPSGPGWHDQASGGVPSRDQLPPGAEGSHSWPPPPTSAVPGAQDPATAQVPRAVDVTGPLPAVPSWPDGGRPRPSLALRLVVAVLVLALLTGIAGIVINWTRPQWLRDLGITRSSAPGASPSTTATTAAPAVVTQLPSGAGAATFAVRAPSFVVAVVPAGSASWVQATASGAQSPLFAGIVQAGSRQSFVVHDGLVVQTGSSSARVYVSVGNKLVGYYAPPSAPFTITFQTAH